MSNGSAGSGGGGTGGGGNGTANTGGGGGGTGSSTPGNGGSGVVILSYPSDKSITLAGGASSSAGEQTDGSRKYIQIETSGTVSFA